jgi:diacylglycerol O-acyltransferase/trehalose O-mycolyltransferase
VRRALGLALLALVLAPAVARAELTQVASQQLAPRLTEYTLKTDALAADTKVRVLLPDGYDPSQRYPVLYLLHGCCDDWRSWTDKGQVTQITAGLPLIVVMPDGGQSGFYTDWYRPGPPRWETYHIGQLVPWVQRTFPVRAARAGRAIAGLSMGGFGALSYASRHPDMFVAAASFSGAVNTNEPVVGGAPDATVYLDGGQAGDIFGPRTTEEVRWRAHNPWDLAENLRPLKLTIRTGNGQPGGPYGGGPDAIEFGVWRMSTSLHERLDALHVEHVWEDYGPGAHDWPYWARDLRTTLPQIMDAFAHPPRTPARVTHVAVEPDYDAYGWHVALKRSVLEFSRLEDAGRSGFALAGSGSATVTTPRFYKRGARYRVAVGDRVSRLRAGRDRRLRIAVDLGPSNTEQQYRAGADTRVTRASVAISRVRRAHRH